MKTIFFLTVVVSLLACSAAPAQQPENAARVGSRTITTKELDDRWRADDPASQADATQKLYDGRRAALDAIIADMLLTEAGKKKNMTAEANINQMQGRPLEVMAPAINRYLTEQQRAGARQALITELRKAGPDVRVLIDAPRRAVDIESSDPSLGRASAPVTLIEFSDFQCPFCQRVAPTIKKLRDTYGDKVRIVWKDFPLTQIHPQAFKAGEAAHCAGDQGKYWEYHDRLFANQQQLQPEELKKHATDLGLDATAFNTCLDSSKYGERVRDGVAQGTRLGVNSTPTIYINGRVLSGAQPYETFVSVIDEELARAK
jgi:protein-disulfide isomerase